MPWDGEPPTQQAPSCPSPVLKAHKLSGQRGCCITAKPAPDVARRAIRGRAAHQRRRQRKQRPKRARRELGMKSKGAASTRPPLPPFRAGPARGHRAQRIRSKRAAFGHTTAPPTRASNLKRLHHPAENGSFCTVTPRRLTTI